MTAEALLFAPLYFFVIAFIVLLYLVAAFVLGVLGALLTLPVLYYTGYGLVPPSLAPASTNTRMVEAALVQLVLGGTFGAASLVGILFTHQTVPFRLEYQFARVSPRLESVPALALGIGVVLAVWLGYLFYRRGTFAEAAHDSQRSALVASIRAATVFGICFLAMAILSTFTLHL